MTLCPNESRFNNLVMKTMHALKISGALPSAPANNRLQKKRSNLYHCSFPFQFTKNITIKNILSSAEHFPECISIIPVPFRKFFL